MIDFFRPVGNRTGSNARHRNGCRGMPVREGDRDLGRKRELKNEPSELDGWVKAQGKTLRFCMFTGFF